MSNTDTKVTELSKIQQIMQLMSMELGAMDVRNCMAMASDITNTEHYRLIRDHELFVYQVSFPKTISTWEDYCIEVIKAPANIVNKEIDELPEMIAVYEELRTTRNLPDMLTELMKNNRILKELV